MRLLSLSELSIQKRTSLLKFRGQNFIISVDSLAATVISARDNAELARETQVAEANLESRAVLWDRSYQRRPSDGALLKIFPRLVSESMNAG